MAKPLSLYLFCLLATIKLIAQSSNTDDLYNEGMKLKNAQNYTQALTVFKNLLEKNPDNTAALFEAGWLSNELKDYSNAIPFLQEAKQIKPSPTVFFELAYAYENTNKKDEAKENYRKAIELYPKYYDAFRRVGDIFYDEENYATALSYFRKYFEAPKAIDTRYYYKAGRCANNLKNYPDAVLYLEKYEASKQEDYAKKYAEMGYSYYMTGYNDDAINAYQQALEADPHYGTALRGIADVYYNNLDDYKNALQYYDLALRFDEENSKDCYYKKGWILMGQEKYDDAIIALQKAANYDAKDYASREQLGYAYFMQNKYDTAIEQFNNALEINAQSRISYYYKGLSYASLNQKTKAMEAYAQLKAINKDDAEKLLKQVKEKEKLLKSLAANQKADKRTN